VGKPLLLTKRDVTCSDTLTSPTPASLPDILNDGVQLGLVQVAAGGLRVGVGALQEYRHAVVLDQHQERLPDCRRRQLGRACVAQNVPKRLDTDP
jgi:hypothetical protein